MGDETTALTCGTNKALEYDVKLLEEYRNVAIALWNSSTNIPPKPQPSGLSRREALAQHPVVEGETRKRPRRSGKIENGGQRKVSVRLLDQIKQLMTSIKDHPAEIQTQAMADLAVMIFQVRDCRTGGVGKGAREASYALYRHFTHLAPQTALALLDLYPKFGYWKDLSEVVRSLGGERPNHVAIRNRAYDLFAQQLHQDAKKLDVAKGGEKPEISLAGKWAPRKGKRFDRDTKVSHYIAQRLFALDFPGKTPCKPYFDGPKPLESVEAAEAKVDETTKENEKTVLTDSDASSSKMTDSEQTGNKEGDNKQEVSKEEESSPNHVFKSHICSYQEMHHYTTTIARLNRYLDTPEIKMCAKSFGEIPVDKIAGKCLNRNKSIFNDVSKAGGERRHPEDEDRTKCVENMKKFVKEAKETGKSAKGTSMNIVELVNSCRESRSDGPEIDLVELQWRDVEVALRKEIEETGLSMGKGLVLADVSGSMTCNNEVPMNLSVGMAILVSHLAEEPFKNKFVTFDSNPQLYDISECKTFKETVDRVMESPWGGSTDFLAAFHLILAMAAEHRLQPEQLPQWFMVVSDMQFDSANGHDLDLLKQASDEATKKYGPEMCKAATDLNVTDLEWSTHHQILKQAFHDVGMIVVGKPYKLPMMIYWNASTTSRIPVLANEEGAQMISGYSPNLLKLFLSNGNLDNVPTPWDTYRNAMDHPSYQPVRKIIEAIHEAPHFINYEMPIQPEEEETKEKESSKKPRLS